MKTRIRFISAWGARQAGEVAEVQTDLAQSLISARVAEVAEVAEAIETGDGYPAQATASAAAPLPSARRKRNQAVQA